MTTEIQRPTSYRYQVLGVACSAAVLTYIHRSGFARALPTIQKSFDLSDQEASWLTTAFLIAYGGFEIPWGWLCDKLGSRHLFTLLVLGWSLTTGCVALAMPIFAAGYQPLVFLILIRFLFGLFQAGGFPCLARILTDWMQVDQRGMAKGLLWAASRLGGALAPWIVTRLIDTTGSWETALWMLAALGALWSVGFWPWFRNRPDEKSQTNAAERELIAAGRPPRRDGHVPVPWRLMLQSRSAWSLCLMYGGGGLAASFYVTLLPTYLSKHRQLSETATDYLSSLPMLFGIVSCLSGGLVSDWIIRRTGNRKWGRRLTGSVGTILGALGWMTIPFVHDVWLLGVVLCAVFFFNDLSMGPAWASAADIGERYAGTLGGAMNMFGNIGGAAGNLIAGYLFGKAFPLLIGAGEDTTTWLQGNTLLFLFYGCSFLFAALCWQGVDVTRKLAQELVTS